MAKLVFGLSQSLDGYVDLELPPPGPALFRHFCDWVGGQSAGIYGRRTYELMRYWDDDRAGWSEAERDFASAWRRQPKWVVSRSLASAGPNATLVRDNVEGTIRELKARLDGEIEIAGPALAQFATERGLIDEYRLYFRPFVLGRGKPFFAGPRPPLRLVGAERIGEDAVRLSYVPG